MVPELVAWKVGNRMGEGVRMANAGRPGHSAAAEVAGRIRFGVDPGPPLFWKTYPGTWRMWNPAPFGLMHA